jgi:hypothetical protein
MSSLTRQPVSEGSSSQDDEDEEDEELEPGGPTFTVTEYESESDPGHTYTLNVETMAVPLVTPHPQYITCTSLTENNMVGDDSDYMPFIAFSDDPSFDHERQTRHYIHFAWQNQDDPDSQWRRKIG